MEVINSGGGKARAKGPSKLYKDVPPWRLSVLLAPLCQSISGHIEGHLYVDGGEKRLSFCDRSAQYMYASQTLDCYFTRAPTLGCP